MKKEETNNTLRQAQGTGIMNKYSLFGIALVLAFILFIYGLDTYSQPSTYKPKPISSLYFCSNPDWGYDETFEKNTDKFIRGWSCNVGMSKNIDTAMHINAYHNFELGSAAAASRLLVKDNLRIAWGGLGHNWNTPGVLQGQAIQYDPEVVFYAESVLRNPNGMDKYHYHEFAPESGDTTGAVFSFKEVNHYLGFGTNYLTVEQRYVPKSITKPILSKPFPDDQLVGFYDSKGWDYDMKDANERNGRSWYITINLKKVDVTASRPTDTILLIKIPYYLGSDTEHPEYIQFDSIPGNKAILGNNFAPESITGDRGDFRGLSHKLIGANASTKSFAITKEMLYQQSNDVTFSAHFYLDNSKIYEQIFII